MNDVFRRLSFGLIHLRRAITDKNQSPFRPFVANHENEACRDASLVLYFSSLGNRSKTCHRDFHSVGLDILTKIANALDAKVDIVEK